MDRPKDRIKKILIEYQLSGKALVSILGLRSSSSLSNILSENPDELNTSMTHRILENLPDLEPKWVKTGEGDMFREGVNISQLVGRNVIRQGHHSIQGNRNVLNQIHTSGYEKIIGPDGTVSIEPTRPQTETGEYAANLEREVEALRRENAEKDHEIAGLKGELKSKNEFIQQLLGKLKG